MIGNETCNTGYGNVPYPSGQFSNYVGDAYNCKAASPCLKLLSERSRLCESCTLANAQDSYLEIETEFSLGQVNRFQRKAKWIDKGLSHVSTIIVNIILFYRTYRGCVFQNLDYLPLRYYCN
jgi:hypothetical protein